MSRLGKLADPQEAFRFLQATRDASNVERWQQITDVNPLDLGQTLLLLSAIAAAEHVSTIPVSDSVKHLFAAEFASFTDPPPAWKPYFRPGHIRFQEMVRVATLRRFPAGQFHWEETGFPRSWLLRSHRLWLLIKQALFRNSGMVFEMHVNARRSNRVVLLEKEAYASYYRAAASMRKQPAITGIMSVSWLFCAETARITPRLSWLRNGPMQFGAMFIDLGSAAPDSGFLVGSQERRDLYNLGLYHPRQTCMFWSRKHLLKWAESHPEFESEDVPAVTECYQQPLLLPQQP